MLSTSKTKINSGMTPTLSIVVDMATIWGRNPDPRRGAPLGWPWRRAYRTQWCATLGAGPQPPPTNASEAVGPWPSLARLAEGDTCVILAEIDSNDRKIFV